MATSQPHNLSFHMHVHPYFDTLVVDAATSNHSIFFLINLQQESTAFLLLVFLNSISHSIIYILSNIISLSGEGNFKGR